MGNPYVRTKPQTHIEMSTQQSNQIQRLTPEQKAQRRTMMLEQGQEIEDIASGALVHFKDSGGMGDDLQVACAIVDLRRALTAEVMEPIMKLMNTDLGFRTDRDPSQRDRDGRQLVPYDMETVRDVVIEAKLRGFRCVGNEFNIISKRFYAAKNGFRRKLTDGKSFPGLSDFRDSYGLPKMTQSGATVVAKASWTINGKADSYEQEFGIKVNSMMGADAIIGKAERKLCKRVHDIIAGINTPDAEAGEDELERMTRVTPTGVAPSFGGGGDDDQIPGVEVPPQAAPVVPAPQPEAAAPAPAPEPSRATRAPRKPRETVVDVAPATPPTPEPPAPTTKVEAEVVVHRAPDPAPVEAPPVGHPSARLSKVILGAGFTFDQFMASPAIQPWFDGQEGRPNRDLVDGFDDVPASISLKLLGKNEGASIVAQLKREHALSDARE